MLIYISHDLFNYISIYHVHVHYMSCTFAFTCHSHMHSHAVDFVLKDPRQQDRESLQKKTPSMLELDIVPKPWAKTYRLNKHTISRSLHLTNPIIRQVLSSWHKNYSKTRLIKRCTLLNKGEVMEMSTYQTMVIKDIEAAKSLLLKK